MLVNDGCVQPAGNQAGDEITSRFGNAWTVIPSAEVEIMPGEAVEQCLHYLYRWSDLFPKGNTWVGRECGVPSLFARIDCVVDETGTLQVFEIEERPCGLGLTGLINPAFKERLYRVQRTWPSFRWVKSDLRDTDDVPWLGQPLTIEEALASNDLVLVRSRPEETDFHGLEERSVSSVTLEGCKQYGEAFGWWDRLRYLAEEERIDHPLDGPYVLKPLRGTRCRFLKVVMTRELVRQYRERGIFISPKCVEPLSQITKLVRREGAMYAQPFVPPMQFAHLPGHNAIYCMIFGYDLRASCWVPLHGFWMALQALLVHGTNKTITGPLVSAI